MKPFFRYVSLLFLIVLAVGGVPSAMPIASAQSNCKLKGLSAADCKLVADASDNLAGLKTFVMDYSVTFQAKGLPNGNVNFSSQGSGPVDVSAVDAANLLDTLSQAVFASKLKSTLTIGPRTLSGTLDLRMVDGFIYIAGSQIPDQDGDKVDVAQLLKAMPTQSQQPITFGGTSFDGLTSIQDSGVVDIPGIYQFKSQSGRAVEGQATTQISLTLNLYAYLTYVAAPEHRDQFKAILEQSGQSLTDDQIDQFVRVLPLLKTTLQATKLQETWLIGKKDKLYHGFGLVFSTRIDPMLINLLGLQADAPTLQPITANATLQVTLSKIGKPVTVQAMGGAVDLTDEVLAQLPGNSGGADGSGNSGNTNDPEAFIPEETPTRYADIQTGKTSEGFATLGNPKARVKIVQLSSYSCAPCQDYYTNQVVPILDEMQAGRVYYTFIPVSLTGEYDAAPATAAAYCALQQNKFWQMHDVLFDWQTRYGSDSTDTERLKAGAKGLGMNVDAFDACLSSPEAADFVKAANDHFDRLNLDSTPSVFVNGKLIHPAPDGEIEPDLRDTVDGLLNGK